jgi:hypothetical protein
MIVPEGDIRDAGEKLARDLADAGTGTDPVQRPAQDPEFKGGENRAKF